MDHGINEGDRRPEFFLTKVLILYKAQNSERRRIKTSMRLWGGPFRRPKHADSLELIPQQGRTICHGEGLAQNLTLVLTFKTAGI